LDSREWFGRRNRVLSERGAEKPNLDGTSELKNKPVLRNEGNALLKQKVEIK
jgi:hypothetical protein